MIIFRKMTNKYSKESNGDGVLLFNRFFDFLIFKTGFLSVLRHITRMFNILRKE